MKKKWEQRYLFTLPVIWSLLLAASASWNLHENYRSNHAKALLEAQTIFEHNLAYRRWNSMHGGVYARIRDINQPNPHIINKNRDVTASDGSMLTMITGEVCVRNTVLPC